MSSPKSNTASLGQFLVVLQLAGLLAAAYTLFRYSLPTDAGAVDFRHGHLNLAGRPGERVKFEVRGETVLGAWASATGLQMEIGGKTTSLCQPKDKSWDDELRSKRRFRGTAQVFTSFILPNAEGFESGKLAGTITGDFQFPEQVGGSFVNKRLDLKIPVAFVLLSEDEATERDQERRREFLWTIAVSLAVTVVSFVIMRIGTEPN